MYEQRAVSSLKNWHTGFCAISKRFRNVHGFLHHYPGLRWTFKPGNVHSFLLVARGVLFKDIADRLVHNEQDLVPLERKYFV